MINLVDPFKIAYSSILSNRLRSVLTTVGVIIGVAAVITLVSMGEGSKTYILNQVRGWGVGSNSLTIHPGKDEGTMPQITMTYEDTIAIKEKVDGVVYVVSEIMGRGRMKYGKKEYTPSFTMGTSSDYPFAVSQKAGEGRFFSKADENAGKHVVVIGKTVATKLFGNTSAIGERIKINNIGFYIVGVLEEKGSMFTYDMDDITLIPSSTALNVLGTDKVYEVFLTTEDEKMVPQVTEDLKKLLIKRHKKEDFHIHTQQGMIDLINNILNALTGIVTAIAAISLLVGGIGIMNIMLVAVTERTKEIGIRKAIGAKNRDIFLQFVMESILITMTGAVLGITVGTLAAWGIMSALKLEAVIAWNAVILSCIVAFLVGTFFGVYPAMRASKLSPVDALRFEI